jgi:hypothetical protein
VLTGDVDKNGVVNPVDAELILQYEARLIASINPHGDVNEDGRMNSVDSLLILQYDARLISHLPP